MSDEELKTTTDAVASALSLEEAKAAAGAEEEKPPSKRSGPGGSDPLLGELRKGGLLHLLVLHFVAVKPSYGNQLIEQISRLTGGWMSVNPNTMYPLLRTLEGKGLIGGEWEHPERRSRRFYKITDEGAQQLDKLADDLAPKLDAVAEGLSRIRGEIFGNLHEHR